jgi:hypothetical protein
MGFAHSAASNLRSITHSASYLSRNQPTISSEESFCLSRASFSPDCDSFSLGPLAPNDSGVRLVVRRPFDAIHDKDLHGPSAGLEFQPKLL